MKFQWFTLDRVPFLSQSPYGLNVVLMLMSGSGVRQALSPNDMDQEWGLNDYNKLKKKNQEKQKWILGRQKEYVPICPNSQVFIMIHINFSFDTQNLKKSFLLNFMPLLETIYLLPPKQEKTKIYIQCHQTPSQLNTASHSLDTMLYP